MKQEPSIEDLRRAEAEAKREMDHAQKAFQNARLGYDLAHANWVSATKALNEAITRKQAESPEP